jgi:soluble cytochrome b562
MSITGISSSNITQANDAQYYQDQLQKIRDDVQQLGGDLQAGNLGQAQSDYTTLSQDISGSQSQNSTLNQDFSALGHALQSGNLSDAQTAYSTLLQDLRQAHHHHHHHHHSGNAQAASQQTNPLTQAFDDLGKALQAGDLSTAQQAYSTLLQDLQQYGLNVGAVSSGSAAAQTPGANLTVTA